VSVIREGYDTPGAYANSVGGTPLKFLAIVMADLCPVSAVHLLLPTADVLYAPGHDERLRESEWETVRRLCLELCETPDGDE